MEEELNTKVDRLAVRVRRLELVTQQLYAGLKLALKDRTGAAAIGAKDDKPETGGNEA